MSASQYYLVLLVYLSRGTSHMPNNIKKYLLFFQPITLASINSAVFLISITFIM